MKKRKKVGKITKKKKRIYWIVGIIIALILIGAILYFSGVTQTAFSPDSVPSEIAEVVNP